MRFWWRELSGWLLIALSLIAFVLVYDFCERRRMTEAWPLTIVGLVIFWGGIQLLKVAIAARICQQAQDRLYHPKGHSNKAKECDRLPIAKV